MDTDVAGEGLAQVDVPEGLGEDQETAGREGGKAGAGVDVPRLVLVQQLTANSQSST